MLNRNLLTISLSLYAIATILTYVTIGNLLLSILWNLLSTFEIYAPYLIPQVDSANSFIIIANLADSINFAIIAVFLAAAFLGFIKSASQRKAYAKKKFEKMSGHVIIEPYNSLAAALARELKQEGIKYVIINDNPNISERLYKEGIVILNGKPAYEESFKLANIAKASYVIAATESDTQNALIAIAAKAANHNIKVISRVSKPENISKLSLSGAYFTVELEAQAGRNIGNEILKHIIS
ncbi:MAG: NAD-binding protein [Candidatus Micrarchaeia archaeon]